MTLPVTLSLLVALAAPPSPAGAGAGAPAASPPAAATTIAGACHGIDRLAWLAGTWSGTAGETEMEEHWTTVKGGTLVGLHRDVVQGKTVSFEFFRIEETADGIVYHTQPRGRVAVPFRCIELGSARIVFENKEHDFPSRILYWTTEDGRLHARIEGTMRGKAESEEWAWTKPK